MLKPEQITPEMDALVRLVASVFLGTMILIEGAWRTIKVKKEVANG